MNGKKRIITGLLALLMLLAAVPALAEETATYNGAFTAPLDAEYLDLGDTRAADLPAFISYLRQFPNLKMVDMFATPVTRAQIEEIVAALPDVEFGWTIRIAEHTVRTDATAFSTLHNSSSAWHGSRDFEVLKYCKNLLALDIGHNEIKDLSFLYDLPQLKVLIVACNQINDITPVGSLKGLEYLELFKNDIHDISCLSELTNLIDLNICFNRIADLTPIMGLTQLERLWIFNSNNYSDDIPVSPAVVAALREALPNTYLDSKSWSTEGGWRKHERYFVINDMFHSGVYQPFPGHED